MQEMQQPEERIYNEGYQAERDYSSYDGGTSSTYSSDAYSGAGYGQKVQQDSELRRRQRVSKAMAICSLITSILIMGLAIALFALNIDSFDAARTASVSVEMGAMLVLSILLFAFSIPGFVFSIIQVTAVFNRYPPRRRGF